MRAGNGQVVAQQIIDVRQGRLEVERHVGVTGHQGHRHNRQWIGKLNRPDVHHDTRARKRTEPRRRLGHAIEPRQRHEQQHIGAGALAVLHYGFAPLRAGLAACKAQLDDLLPAEERKARRLELGRQIQRRLRLRLNGRADDRVDSECDSFAEQPLRADVRRRSAYKRSRSPRE